ncbi:MAG: 2'-5' RNA ligase family protein [Candidatus Caldatribacteriota bacterium]
MVTKLFVGLTFYSDNSFSKNIESFRSRFDSKYQSNPYLHVPIVPPFEIESSQLRTLKDELIEELEGFYFENFSHHTLRFTGLNVHEYKKNKILYLNPVVDEELSMCQESLFSICKSYVDRNKRMKDKKSFLTIGRYQEVLDLHLAIELAQKEFHEFTALPFESICLFSKNNGTWYREADLVSFDRPVSNLLQKSEASL